MTPDTYPQPKPKPRLPLPQLSTTSNQIDPFAARTDAERWSILSSRRCPLTPVPPFLYGVLSTKIYCRPTCSARLARRANVVFFDTAGHAEEAGFRACRRCRPDVGVSVAKGSSGKGAGEADGKDGDRGGRRERVEEEGPGRKKGEDEEDVVVAGDGEEGRRKVGLALRIVRERAERGEIVGLAELGKEVGLSKWHLLRVFRRRWGVSPRVMGEGVVAETRRRNRLLEAEHEDTASRVPEAGGHDAEGSGRISEADTSATLPVLDGGEVSTADWESFEAEDFDLGGYADIEGVPDLWDGEQDMLRELFPEVYQYEDVAES
jgi:methylphosphotriester-DNA--protein-cysteine methyltransferase